MKEIRVNREIEELRLSSIDFSTDIISNLSEFVANNFALKSLNLSWSEISSDDLLLFLSRIEQIKHLQHFDISTIPFQGPSLDKLVDLLKQFIVNNPSLIHLNISSCNLSSNEIKILLEGIRKSKSLLSVHLSGNTNQEDIAKLLGTNCRKPSLRQLISGRPDQFKKFLSSSPGMREKLQNRLDSHKRQSMMLELYRQNQQKKLGLAQERKSKFETVDSSLDISKSMMGMFGS